jgi:tetratricopeptide (TPR) repeat protein
VLVQNARIETQRQLAVLQQARAERVARFAKEVLAQSHALTGRGPGVTLRQALDDAAAHVDDEGWNDPAIEAEIKDLLGSCYRSLSLPDVAAPFVERAVSLRRQHDGPSARATLEVEQELALLRLDQERDGEALQLLDALRARSAAAFGERDRLTLSADHDRALVLRLAGRLPEAEALYERTLAARREVLGPDDPATLVTQHNLGVLLLYDGRTGAARELLQDCLERRQRVLGDDHPDTLMSADNLGECWRDLGDPDRAIALHRAALQGLRQRLGEDQEWTLGAAYHLVRAYSQKGDIDAMLQLARETLPHCEVTFGKDDHRTLDLRSAIASAALAKGGFAAAEQQYRAIVATLRSSRTESDAAVVTQEQNLAVALLRQGRTDDALALLAPQLQLLADGAELPLPVAATSRLLHAKTLAQLQRWPEAEAQLRALRTQLAAQLPAQHPLRIKVAEALAEVCDGVGKAAEASALRGEAAGR